MVEVTADPIEEATMAPIHLRQLVLLTMGGISSRNILRCHEPPPLIDPTFTTTPSSSPALLDIGA